MRIYSTQNYQANLNFCSAKIPRVKRGFFYDYDDSLAKKMSTEIRSKIRLKQKQHNAELIIVSGNTPDELMGKLAKLGPEEQIPKTKYIISNDGAFIYQSIHGQWVKDEAYEAYIRTKTKYHATKVLETLEEMSKSKEFKFPKARLETLRKLENFKEIKQSDPIFYNSLFTPYSWNPTEFTNKIFVASGIDLKELERKITKSMLKQGIKVKFIKMEYPKNIMDKCSKSILLQSNPARRNSDGSMTALFLQPALKADGVEYLANKLGIKHENMLLAGDAENDKSLVHLVKKGATFLCFENARNSIKALCEKVKQKHPQNIYISNKEGAEGIVDGMEKILID